ncbi:MAG: sigma-70 family RNA polymerase sigma factor [Aureispira sp.]|nr:sigma-70 family RNA polymerase sigma factor [Aureispira sp.]
MNLNDPKNKLELLDQLRLGKSTAIKEVYKMAYPVCAKFITNNNGTTDDAKDLFQEVLVVFLKKLRLPDFVLTAAIPTYMYAITRNLWLKQLRKHSKKPIDLVLDEPESHVPLVQVDELEEKVLIEAKHEHISEVLATIKEDCQKLLVAFYFKKMSLKEIAKEMDYSDGFVKVKKKRCMDGFKKKVLESWKGGD